jgi:hypothetical protein
MCDLIAVVELIPEPEEKPERESEVAFVKVRNFQLHNGNYL